MGTEQSNTSHNQAHHVILDRKEETPRKISDAIIVVTRDNEQQNQPIEDDTLHKPLFEFELALKNNVKYLQSSEFKTRGDSDDTIDSIPTLVNINKLGLLTIDSQPGIQSRYKGIKTGKPTIQHQRAYVVGFMKRKDAEEFVGKFNTDISSDKLCIVHSIIDDEKHVIGPSFPKPRPLRLPLTMQQVNGQPMSIVTADDSPINQSTILLETREAGLLLLDDEWKEFVRLICFDTKWNRNARNHSGLHSYMIKILKQLERNQSKTIKDN